MNSDECWMAQALALARKGFPRTSPNPLVGALVVRQGRLISRGHHAFFGGPHAEAVALKKAGAKARGGTLYVTLEPCSSWGKTPPCVDAVTASGVRRVVIGSADPNPVNHRKGIRELRKAGKKVTVGILAEAVERQNEAFFKTQRQGIPFVTLKMAQSLDGKIAARSGRSRWITSPPARHFVHRLRDEVDAVMVGTRTAVLDDPRLQGARPGEKPWRVVLDRDFSLPRKARIFQGRRLTFVAVSEKRIRTVSGAALNGRKILIPLPERKGRLDLKKLLQQLAGLGVNHLLVEGGGELAWSLISAGYVDRLVWIIASKILGGRGSKTSVEGEGIDRPDRAFRVEWEKVYPLGEDWVFEGRPCSRES